MYTLILSYSNTVLNILNALFISEELSQNKYHTETTKIFFTTLNAFSAVFGINNT